MEVQWCTALGLRCCRIGGGAGSVMLRKHSRAVPAGPVGHCPSDTARWGRAITELTPSVLSDIEERHVEGFARQIARS